MSKLIENKDVSIYLAQEKLAEWGEIIVEGSVRKSKYYQNKSERLRYYLKAIQYEFFLEEQELIYLLQCINKIAEITEWPTAPVLTEKEQPSILLGVPGVPGQDGADGADGSDATVNVVGDPVYDNITVTESVVNGIRTFNLGYAPYTTPTISVAVQTSNLPNANSKVQELGVFIDVVYVQTTTNKGRDEVVDSTFVNPSGLDVQYDTLWDKNAINAGTPQVITVNDTTPTATTTYTVNIEDAQGAITDSDTITFVDPFLYGASGSVLAQDEYKTTLSKLIQTQGNKAVKLNGTDSYFYFCYPFAYGQLSEILDQSNLNATDAFTLLNPAGTPVDVESGTGVSYLVYRTAITDIPNQTYTFKF